MTDDIDVLVSRHKELRGKHVAKIPHEIVDLESAWKELVEDYAEMCANKENKNHCERVYRASRRIARTIADWYDANGLELPEYLSRPRQPKEAGSTRYDIPSKPSAGARVGFPANARRGKPRN